MAQIKPKPSLSSNNFLTSFRFASFLTSFLVLFLFSISGSKSPFCIGLSYKLRPGAFFGRSISLHGGRFPRSPFLPPTVTSFKPSIRKSNNTELKLRVGQSGIEMLPPMVSSQFNIKPQPKKIHVSNLNHGFNPPVTLLLPRPPMVVQYKELVTKTNRNDNGTEEISVIPQNDEHSEVLIEKQGDQILNNIERVGEKNTSAGKQQTNKENVFVNKGLYKESKPTVLLGFHEILHAIGIKVDELQSILKRQHISFDNFLEFINNGRTKEEIMKFLKLNYLSEYSKDENKFSSDQKNSKRLLSSVSDHVDQNYVKTNRQKMLVEMPFTEIVHEVPVGNQKSYKELSKSGFSSEGSTDNSQILVDESISSKAKNRIREDNYKEKIHKYKRNKEKSYKDNPFLMNSDSDISTMLPHKDSPIIIPFLPPQRKNDRSMKDSSASIISMTVEEKKKQEKQAETTTKVFKEPLPIRNKVLYGVNEKDLHPPISEKSWNDNSYEQQQANLRLVFPMRSILMFCGVLGIIAVMTIIMLIIYGAVKCNKKPISSSYELSDHQNISSS